MNNRRFAIEELEHRSLLAVQPFPTAPTLIGPPASGIFEGEVTGLVDSSELQSYTVEIGEGQLFSAVLEAENPGSAAISIRNPNGDVVASTTLGSSDPIAAQDVGSIAGTYTIEVASNLQTPSSFSLSLLFNAAYESERLGFEGNDFLTDAQSLATTFQTITESPAARAGILGSLDSTTGEDVDWYSLQLANQESISLLLDTQLASSARVEIVDGSGTVVVTSWRQVGDTLFWIDLFLHR
ncbi:MAG: hypothetical protein KDA61_08315, partial [Planctomycetales bacterium]|nr:hypothetical protein [Planctomycetales bacterium]